MERVADTLKGAADKSRQAGEFIMRNKKGAIIILGLFLMVVMLLNVMSSCSVLAEAILGSGGGSTYAVIVNLDSVPLEMQKSCIANIEKMCRI